LHEHDALVRKGSPHMAARVVSYGSAVYGWAVRRKKLAANPFVGLPVAKATERERVLEDPEIAAVWRGTGAPGAFNAITRMLLLTGQRRNEIAGMTRNEISPDGTTWTIPKTRTKNGVTRVVPLSTQAQVIIAAQPRSDTTSLIFPGARGDNVCNGWGKAKPALDRASGVTGWVLHDLRRTVATNLQRLGVRLEVTEAVLNHVGGSRAGIVGVYQRHTWTDEKQAALQAWADRLDAIIEGRATESAGNVVPLRA
jgi:integrase